MRHPSWPIIVAMVLAQLPVAARAGTTDDACALLTAAQVRAVVGAAVRDGTYVKPTAKTTCTWTATNSASGIRGITLSLLGVLRFTSGKSSEPVSPTGVMTVGSLGDVAYYPGANHSEGLIVEKGERAIRVAVDCTLPLEKKRALEKTLAQQVLAKL